MENYLIIKDIFLLLACALPVIYIFHKIKLPPIIGFIITGLIIGPFGIGLIKQGEGIHYLAEIGVALLLFSIGIEISFSRFKKLVKEVIFTGGFQVLFTIIAGFVLSLFFNFSITQAILIGFLLSHSSSALIMKILNDNDELNAPQGKISMGILVFQDLIIVPMMIFIPILGMTEKIDIVAILAKIGLSALLIVLIIYTTKVFLPYLLKMLVNLNMRDVLIVGVFVIILGTALLTSLAGLSIAIGAFIAGLIISESEFSHEVVSEVMPFKDVFLSIFFVSLGMLLDVSFLLSHPFKVIYYTVMILLLKFIIIYSLLQIIGYSGRIAFIVGVLLAQIGEFSFVLLTFALPYNIIPEPIFKGFIAASVITMILTPLLYKQFYKFSFKVPDILKVRRDLTEKDKGVELRHHVIIVGYGLNGRNLAKVLKETGIKFAVIEMNIAVLNSLEDSSEKIIYGDATNREILELVNIKDAKVIVFAISDPGSVKIGVKIAKRLNPSIYVIVRTRLVEEIEHLIQIGADEVIPEEFETSIQIFSRVLRLYHIPQSVIYTQSNIIRSQSYGLLRNLSFTDQSFSQINQILAQGTIDVLFISEDNSYIGKSLREIDLRGKTGATVISVVRKTNSINNPSGDFVIEKEDQLIIYGNHISIDNAVAMIMQKNNSND